MRRAILLAASLSIVGTAAASTQTFDSLFLDATLRVDLYHTGNAVEEHFTVDRILRQGLWAGPRAGLDQPDPLGRYRARLVELDGSAVRFEHGFDSYFGEYRTTSAAADGVWRTFHESVLLPMPRRPLRLLIEARPRTGNAATLLDVTLDPSSPAIAAEPPAGGVVVVEASVPAPPSRALDVLILGEGYTAAEEGRFREDLGRFAAVLLAQEPFAGTRDVVAIRGVLAPSRDSGCDEPTHGRYKDTALGLSFNALGSPRYLLTEDNRAMRDIAANAPYDTIAVMVNHDRYGGGGIYNAFCTFTAHNHWSSYLLVHELGHSFAGLADEYFTSSVAYNDFYPPGVEPPEANITALADGGALKWGDLVEPGTPLPTPWRKSEFETMDRTYQARREAMMTGIADAVRSGAPETEVRRLREVEDLAAREHARRVAAFLAGEEGASRVGAYEGAGYSARGLYRPMLDCVMFSKGLGPYCRVCERAVKAQIERYAR